MQFVRRSLTGLVMLMVSLGLLVASGLLIRDALQSRMDAGPPARPAEERVFAARVITLQPSRVHPVLTAYGEVRARRVLELRMLSGGTVTALAVGFEDGGRVIAGETLLRLDTAEAATARDLAAADVARAGAEEAEAARALSLAHDDLASAEAQAALRDQALARQRDLAERGIGSEAAVETAELAAAGADQAVVSRRQALSQAETQVALAKTATDRQKITLASAGRALADTELRAEFTGLLDGVTVSLGGSVSLPTERMGRFDFSAVATWTKSYKISNVAGVPLAEVIGTDSTGTGDDGYLEWRGRVQAEWTMGNINVVFSGLYTDSFLEADPDEDGSNTVDSTWIFDTQINYTLFPGNANAFLADTKITVANEFQYPASLTTCNH